MRNSAVVALLGGAVLLAALYPALAQDAPESILPPGFGEPIAPSNTVQPLPGDAPREPTGIVPDMPVAEPDGEPADSLDNSLDNALVAEEDPYDLPAEARRSVERVGLLAVEDGGMSANAFGDADGRFLFSLMQRIDAPIASRWGSILLRRALLSQTDTPAGIGGADWAAARSWLLVRMGEADDARALVQRVDAINYTPALYEVAMQAALATADPSSLCNIADAGAAVMQKPAWPLAQAMCAGLAGEGITAGSLVDRARRRNAARGIDVQLAQKVIGAGTGARRAITIEWNGVSQLTAWRFGMATATGVTVPAELYATVGPQVRAWQARAPLLAPDARLAAAERAATLGVFSSAALVDLYGMVFDSLDEEDRGGTLGATVRNAYAGNDAGARLSALRGLWDVPEANRIGRYARLLLAARAAAVISPEAEGAASAADQLVEAMFSGGLDTQAARWAGVAEESGQAWGLLAVGLPRASMVNTGQVTSYGDAVGSRRKLLFAALAGLERLTPDDINTLAQDLRVPITRQTSWTRALERAVLLRQPATVALLCATGMQTLDWAYVPPAQLYHIVSSLRRVGLEAEARMIAAEALTRA